MSIALSNFQQLPMSNQLLRPQYKPEQLSGGIFHIGMGNFHRAHQAVYLDALFNLGKGHDWAIVGGGLMPADTQRRAQLQSQNWMTTVVDIGASSPVARITASMVDFCECEPHAMLSYLLKPSIRLVTLTITEGGYFIDPDTGEFNDAHPDIIHDIQNFSEPKSVFGILLRALFLRKQAGTKPFTVLSCDNLLGNGEATHHALLGLADKIDGVDVQWAKDEISCPNSMVDCITPAMTAANIDFVRQNFGLEDEAPVLCEPFRQWVIEDRFVNGRPALEHVGVQFTDDVRPYELLKLNILNAGHAIIAYAGALLGWQYAHEAIQDADILAWFNTVLKREVLPTLSAAKDIHPADYLQSVTERFANPAIKDSLSRLCEDGENRQPKFIFPSIVRAFNAGTPVDGLALEVALWCRFLADNPMGDSTVVNAARATQNNPDVFLNESGVFGDLQHNEILKERFSQHISSLWTKNPRDVLKQYTHSYL